MSPPLMGTVTAATADQYTIKTDAGAVYTVHLADRTRIVKMPPFERRQRGQGSAEGQSNAEPQGSGEGQGNGEGQGMGGRGRGMGGNPPQVLKPTDIKVGDVIQVRGEVDETAKSVPAMFIVQLDPERVAMIREQNAKFGQTWLMGRVTAVNETKVTLMGSVDNAPHTFVADEDTIFRHRRDPITLADIQVGDIVRVDGAVKDGVFTAKRVNSMGAPPANSTVPRNPPAAPVPPQQQQ